MAESDFQKYLDSRFQSVMNELGHIRRNTERTNGKVAEQEKRLRELENYQNRCPIKDVQRRQTRLEDETRNLRAWAKLIKPGFAMAVFTAIALILQIIGVI
jgi:hypothetical protein